MWFLEAAHAHSSVLHQVLINSWILSTCSYCPRKNSLASDHKKALSHAASRAWGSSLRICCDVNIFFFLKQKINIATLQESTADIIQCCYRNHRCVPKQNISMKSEAEHRMPHCACTTIRQSPEKKQWSNPSATPPHTIQRLYQLHPHLLPYERRQ